MNITKDEISFAAKNEYKLNFIDEPNQYALMSMFTAGAEWMQQKLPQADVSGSLPLLRELVMRGQFAFPENEDDLKWFDEGINHKFMEELMSKLSLGKEIEGNDR